MVLNQPACLNFLQVPVLTTLSFKNKPFCLFQEADQECPTYLEGAWNA